MDSCKDYQSLEVVSKLDADSSPSTYNDLIKANHDEATDTCDLEKGVKDATSPLVRMRLM